MSPVLLLAAGPGEARAALLEGEEIVELRIERAAAARAGEVCLGRVVAVLPGMSAALLDIGAERPALLERKHALAPFHEGQRLVVQVVREARAEKGPAVTARLALGGALLALTPGRPGVRVPTEIQGDVLRQALLPLLGEDEGLNLRAGAAGAEMVELEADLARLRARWSEIRARAESAVPGPLETPPSPLRRLAEAAIEEWSPSTVRVDTPRIAAELRGLAEVEVAPGTRALIDEAVEAALRPVVPLPGGGSITIEPTRAATLIDVDGGGAKTLLDVNKAAAREAARQIRLRNIGGQILIDFVSMEAPPQRQAVLDVLSHALKGDLARPHALGWTRMGLVEVTRRRRHPSLLEVLTEPSDRRKTALTVALEALAAAERAAGTRPVLRVHPEVAAALDGPAAAARAELEARLHVPIAIEAASGIAREAFDLV
ncbi:MAG: ribonuclease E/G [Rhodospirillales bacterium]|nr:ribonuclease E/G [Rhodospirillales bacterium]